MHHLRCWYRGRGRRPGPRCYHRRLPCLVSEGTVVMVRRMHMQCSAVHSVHPMVARFNDGQLTCRSRPPNHHVDCARAVDAVAKPQHWPRLRLQPCRCWGLRRCRGRLLHTCGADWGPRCVCVWGGTSEARSTQNICKCKVVQQVPLSSTRRRDWSHVQVFKLSHTKTTPVRMHVPGCTHLHAGL